MSSWSARALVLLLSMSLVACEQVDSPEREVAVAPATAVAPGEDCPNLSGLYNMVDRGGTQWFKQSLPAQHEPHLLEISLNEFGTQYRLRTIMMESVLKRRIQEMQAEQSDRYEQWLRSMREREALRKRGESTVAIERQLYELGLLPDYIWYEPRRRCHEFWGKLGDVPNAWYPGINSERAETELWAGRAENGDMLLRYDHYTLMESPLPGNDLRRGVNYYYLRWPEVHQSEVAWTFEHLPLPAPKPKVNREARVDALVALNADLIANLPDGMSITAFNPPDDGGKAMRESDIVSLSISGSSPSNKLISDFLRYLAGSEHFAQVDLVSIRQDEQRMLFEIIAKWRAPMYVEPGS